MPSANRQPLLVANPAIVDRIAKRTGQEPKPITVKKMVGTKDVAQFMRLVTEAQKSTRRMGMFVR